MTKQEYLDAALELICDITDDDHSFVCDRLREVPSEKKQCEKECGDFDRFCLLRYLRYYSNDKKV